ncbi:hypothetical protein TL16_g11245 [Triparma laevis f. inornata]|uniref:Uncharacterized protein n=1 Tax=Triparma laevis f. inornata TaxID=1714386 RepID=A0A9W7BHN9_9STRA|nr:hypothetical protein TL16_g11245 [Triparma laevis f. inornata]
MSKSVTSETHEGYESREMSGDRGEEDQGNKNGEELIEVPPAESLTISTVFSTVPATVNDFMHTIEFKGLFTSFVHEQTLMVLRVLNKEWNGMADARIDEGVRSGELMVHDGNAISEAVFSNLDCMELVTRVVFLLNITKIGKNACYLARNLVVVDIPEDVESIGEDAFSDCYSLTTVSFPSTSTIIGEYAFEDCSCLENVDLLHTNLQRLGRQAFHGCSELKSMMIPDSLQTIGYNVFFDCKKLVPGNIDNRNNNVVVTPPPLQTTKFSN